MGIPDLLILDGEGRAALRMQLQLYRQHAPVHLQIQGRRPGLQRRNNLLRTAHITLGQAGELCRLGFHMPLQQLQQQILLGGEIGIERPL
ncbi:hypothetical protein D3C78_1708620 [compost metagenome]